MLAYLLRPRPTAQGSLGRASLPAPCSRLENWGLPGSWSSSSALCVLGGAEHEHGSFWNCPTRPPESPFYLLLFKTDLSPHCGAQSHNPAVMTRAEIRGQMLNPDRHPSERLPED